MSAKIVTFNVRHAGLLGLLFLVQGVFAAIPIQEKSLNGMTAAEARNILLVTAESYLGTPYRYAGIDRRGLDCSGLVYLSFKEGLNHTIPRTAESIYNWVEKIGTADLQIGDLVFFITAGSAVSHVGLYAGDGWFIHSASEGLNTGVLYSHLSEAYWNRTYIGAGRALPWDEAPAQTIPIEETPASAGSSGKESGKANTHIGSFAPPKWEDSGLYTGFGAAWNWGGFFEGSPSIFRGISSLVTIGYKFSAFNVGLEIRPVWDGALGIFRLPFTVSLGTDYFQIFGGPAYTFGEPRLSLNSGARYYAGGWRWEAGLSGAFPLKMLNRGILSLYGELVWQSYPWGNGIKFEFRPDITANVRFSTGLRYLWHF